MNFFSISLRIIGRENVGYHLVLDEITLGAALYILVNSAATTNMQPF